MTVESALPGVELAAFRCWDCERAGAIPLEVLIERSVSMGGLQHAPGWWFEVVHATVPRVRITCEELDLIVQQRMQPAIPAPRTDPAHFYGS